MKWKQGLPTYTPEPLWDYSWFHQLLKILLHNWAPPPTTESLDPPLISGVHMVFNANFNSISAISGVHMVFNANVSSMSAISGVHMVFNANISSISAISWCTQTICSRHVRHRSVSTLVLLLNKWSLWTLHSEYTMFWVDDFQEQVGSSYSKG